MSLIMLALLAMQADPARKDLPIHVPPGWESQRSDDALLLLPKELPKGKTYAVLIPTLTRKVGTLRGLLDTAKETVADEGTFKPLAAAARSRSDGDWEYEFEIGTLERDGKYLMALAMGLKRKDDEGIILLIADSVETLQKYADGFAQLVKSVGAPKLVEGAAAAKSTKHLKYSLPAGWEEKEQGETVVLQKWENKGGTAWPGEKLFTLVICAPQPLKDSLRKTFHAAWTAEMKPAVETNLLTLPLMRRLKSGLAVAYDVHDGAKNKDGKPVIAGLYVLSQGKLTVPILVFSSGTSSTFERDLLALLESATITGAGDAKAALFDAADLAGHWDKSAYSAASFVTASGAFAGDASIAIEESHTLNADGTFTFEFKSVRGSGGALQIRRQGRWTVDDESLVLTSKDGEERYRLFGVGGDEKAGRFLVLSIASGTQERLDLTEPRRMFSGSWFKKKD